MAHGVEFGRFRLLPGVDSFASDDRGPLGEGGATTPQTFWVRDLRLAEVEPDHPVPHTAVADELGQWTERECRGISSPPVRGASKAGLPGNTEVECDV